MVNTLNDKMPRHHALRVRAFAMGVGQQELASRSGYHRVYVSDLLRGVVKSEPGLNNIERVLDEIANERSKRAA